MVMMSMNWSKGCFESIKYPELKRGQVIHSWSGMNGCYHSKSVLVSTSKDKWGTHYRAVNMETFDYIHPNAPLPMEEKKSIGSYFENGEILSEEDVIRYEKLALEKKKRYEIQQELERIAAEKLQDAGRVLFDKAIEKHGLPKALLIAELHQNESDSMTDYFSSRTVRKVILAFSKHTRNDFREFRKAALNSNIQEIRVLATAPVKWEHRENYSMGGGYYLGKHRYSGWQIRKEKFYHSQGIEHYYEIAGKDDGFAITSNQDNSTFRIVN